jgi:alpha-mannosidase
VKIDTPSQASAQVNLLTRRSVLRTMSAAATLWWAGRTRLSAATPSTSTPTLFYMDGYHGGVRGHMPEGCWRDILQAMERHPEWKLSLDVEADSWSVLERQDSATLRRLIELLNQSTPTPRVEMTGGTFSQPYGWAISGESNIRQMARGLELIHRSFPGLRVETYAVQEPCWASCLPQILRSFGFTGASLKNASTAWGGYTRGFDAELVNWIGPDGTPLLAVPRYEQEHLLNVWETEATEVTPDYAQRCAEHGIPQPAGMCFQDLGWAAQPRVNAPWVQFATWHEYLHTIARIKPVDWHFTMEDILTALPWGEKTLQRASQQVREAEVQLVHAEKCAAMACLTRNLAWPSQTFEHAWDQAMWAQAHDAWITVTTRSGRQAWAFQVASETLEASDSARQIVADSVHALCTGTHTAALTQSGDRFVRAVHTQGHDRSALIEITLSTGPATEAFEVRDPDGRVLAHQVNVIRQYRDIPRTEGLHTPIMERRIDTLSGSASINAATILFRDTLPGFGWKTYKIATLQTSAPPAAGLTVTTSEDGSVIIESDFYRLRLDATRGGGISSLYARQLNKEFCAEGRLLNEFRGFFVKENEWRSSAQSKATLDLLEVGPLRARVQILGAIGGCPFRATVTVMQGELRIDCDVTFRFDEDTFVGDPWDIRPEDRNKVRRRSSNDGRPKLQAIFPATLSGGFIDKSSAFEVCRSRNASTHFQRWDEIRHNIITNWVDLFDKGEGIGLAILSDRTTAYSHGEGEPLGLILGWGGEAGYWWGRCPLRGDQQARYALIPHRGSWAEAGLWQENQAFEEAVIAQEMPTVPSSESVAALLHIRTPHTTLSSVMMVGGEVQVRLFGPSSEAEGAILEVGFPVQSARLVELDGRQIHPLQLAPGTAGRSTIHLEMPAFAIRTLRLTPALHVQTSKDHV